MSIIYDYSVFIGRFQPFHLGHLHNITKALEISKKLIINVGSSFNSPNIKNPFSFEQRKQMILADLEVANIDLNRIIVEPIADYFYQEEKWELELRNNIQKNSSSKDKIVVVGHQKDASSYYLKSFPEWDYLSVDNYKDYNATCFRKLYYKNKISLEYMVSKDIDKGSYKFLEDFKKTDLFMQLSKEFTLIEEYKHKLSHINFKPILVTVHGLVIVGDKILLVKRRGYPGKFLWSLPGGFLEHGDFIAQSTIKKIYKKTSVNISEESLSMAKRDTIVFDYPSRSVRGQTVTHVTPFIFSKMDKLPNISQELYGFYAKWFSIEKISQDIYNRMYDDHYQIINIILDKLFYKL